MTNEECGGGGWCKAINGSLYCAFGGFLCPVGFIDYCQKGEREEE